MTSKSITGEYRTYTTHFSPHYLQKGFELTASVSEHQLFAAKQNPQKAFFARAALLERNGVIVAFALVQFACKCTFISGSHRKVWVMSNQSRKQRNEQMDTTGLKRLPRLSVAGNGRPPWSGLV